MNCTAAQRICIPMWLKLPEVLPMSLVVQTALVVLVVISLLHIMYSIAVKARIDISRKFLPHWSSALK